MAGQLKHGVTGRTVTVPDDQVDFYKENGWELVPSGAKSGNSGPAARKSADRGAKASD